MTSFKTLTSHAKSYSLFSISSKSPASMAAEDGADPPSIGPSPSSPSTTSIVQPAFNPIPYNFPTRFSIPSDNGTYSSMLLSLWHKSGGKAPGGKAITTYLNDIEEMAKPMALTEGEMVSMAVYYADPDNRLLWKELINSSKGNGWAQFKKDMKWYYPDAHFDTDVLNRSLYSLGSSSAPIHSDSELKPIFGFDNPPAMRSYIIGFLRILDDLPHIRHKASNRVICQRFAKGLPNKELRKKVGERLREKYPSNKDEFDCIPKIFFYYTFFTWRDELIREERNWLIKHGF